MINPRPLRIAHVMMIRLSHALDSSTVFPDLEKFIKSKATDAVTTAAMVEIRIIWLPHTQSLKRILQIEKLEHR